MSSPNGDILDVPTSAVVADKQSYPRVKGTDTGRVALVLSVVADGAELPPIDVFEHKGRYYVGDGFHRLSAYRALKRSTVRVRVLPYIGDVRTAAYLHSLDTAATAALPLSPADRRASVHRLLTSFPDMSDREIARRVGVSPTTVGNQRRALSGQAKPVAETGERYLAAVTARDLADRLVSSLEKLWDARGLSDLLLGDRTGKRLAAALTDRFGDDAPAWAHRLHQWTSIAVQEVEAS